MLNNSSFRKQYGNERRLLGLNPPVESPAELEEPTTAIVSATVVIGSIFLCVIMMIAGCLNAKTAHAEEYTDTQIVNAIYKTEGGKHAKKPYGILSVRCTGKEDCRRVCLRTVKNNRIRYSRNVRRSDKDFLAYLARIYAPLKAGNDPQGLNRNWLNNVSFFLRRDA